MKQLTRTFYELFLISFFMSFGNNTLMPLVSVYADSFHVSLAEIAFISSLFSIPMLFTQPFVGPILASKNKKKVLQASIIVITSSMVVMTFSSTILHIKIARILHGLGVAFSVTSCLTLVTETTDKKVMDKAISIYGLAEIATSAICPAIGLKLVAAIGYHKTFAVSVCSLILAFIATLFFKYECEETEIRINLRNIVDRDGVLPMLATVIYQAATSPVSTFIIIYMNRRGIEDASFYFVIQSVSLILSKVILNKLLDYYDKTKLISAAYLVSFTGFIMLAIGARFCFYIIPVVFGIASGFINPLLQSFCVENLGDKKRSTAVSMSYMGVSVGGFIGSNISGQVSKIFEFNVMFLVMAPFVLLSMAAVYLNKKIRENKRIYD